MKPMPRMVLVVATLLLTAIGAPPAMSATTVGVIDPFPTGRVPGQINVTGDNGKNRITVEWSTKRRALIVEDIQRIESERCDRLAAKKVSCPFQYEVLEIDAEKGRDQIVVRRETTRFDDMFIDGGPGSDYILGSDGVDFIDGGQGNDRLRGRGAGDFLNGDDLLGKKGGDDVVRGGAGGDWLGDSNDRGSDFFYGEAGRDLIDAKDGFVDRVINGGPGKDECNVEPKDPKPVRCER